MLWMLEGRLKALIENAEATGYTPTAAQLESFTAASLDRGASILSAGGEIKVEGILTNAPDFLAMLFGGGNTTYPDIIKAVAELNADDNIERGTMLIDSPGGQVDGLIPVMDAIANSAKPIDVRVGSKALSAAYGIAAMADTITATSRASRLGSIGIQLNAEVDDAVINLKSSNAPNKNPDVTTVDGKAAVIAELDASEKLFIDTIAKGRGTTEEDVKQNFGRGGVLLAEDALARGMIDAVESVQTVKPDASAGATEEENTAMANPITLESLKTDAGEVYAAAVDIGVLQGVADERTRVAAHVKMGEKCGDMAVALAAIASGDGMTEELQGKYVDAAASAALATARKTDDAAAASAATAAAPGAEGSTAVLDLMESDAGIV